MSGSTLPDLGDGADISDADLFYTTQSGVDKKVTGTQIKAYAAASGGSNSITLTAGTNLAAGTAVAINGSGQAVQTWGAAPQIAGTATLSGMGVSPAALVLDASHFVAFQGASGAQAGSIDGSLNISMGAADTSPGSVSAVAWGANVGLPVAAALTGSLYVVPYNDSGSGNATIAAFSVGGSNAITPGTPVQITTQAFGAGGLAGYTGFFVIALSSSHFALLYSLADASAWVLVGSVSGTDITLGDPVELTTQVTASQGNAVLGVLISSSEFLAAYCDAANSAQLSAVVVSVSGTICSLNSVAVDAVNTSEGPSDLALLSPSLGVASFYENGLLEIFSVSGTTVTLANVEVSPQSPTYLKGLDATHFLLAPTVGSSTDNGPLVGTMSGSSLSSLVLAYIGPGNRGTPYPLTVGSVSATPVGWCVSDDDFAIAFIGSDASVSPKIEHQFLTGYWLYTLGSNSLAVLTDRSGAAYARVVRTETPQASGPVGFVASAVTEGDDATVNISGIIGGFTGLTPGAQYFVSGDGTVTTANTGHLAGVALDPTTLLASPQPASA